MVHNYYQNHSKMINSWIPQSVNSTDGVDFAMLFPLRLLQRWGIKAATSVGANYNESNRSRSKAEFKSKIGIVEQEADESLYWLELRKDSGIAKGALLEELLLEADELVAIFTTIGKKSKQNSDFIHFPTSAFRLPTSIMGGFTDGKRHSFYF